MCGIVGIISNEPISREVIKGLRALDNRGQNSSGIIGYNSLTSKFDEPKKGIGSSQEVFNKNFFKKEVDMHKGNVVIGHNRYATAGSDLETDMQPLFIPRPEMVIAHNGQVLNIVSLKDKLIEKKWFFKTECDAEALIMALAQNLIEKLSKKNKDINSFLKEKLYPSLEDIMRKEGNYHVNGAYSCVVTLAGKGLLGFRDPHGIRPLSFARKEAGNKVIYAFASETSAFNYMKGYKDLREVKRGEAIFIDEQLKVHSKIIYQEKEAFCSFEPNYFAGPDSDLKGVKVYDAHLLLGKALAEYFVERKKDVDVIMPVPKTAISAAIEMARKWKKDYREGLIVRGETRSFLESTQKEREEAVDDKHIYIKSQINGKRIGLVEDSIVRGTTLRIIISKIRELGARAIHAFFTYDMIRYPCFSGIDTPEKDKLIAARHKGNLEGISRELGADSVNYFPNTLFGKAIGIPNNEMCFACVTGKYPTDISEWDAYVECRKRERAQMVKNKKC